MSTVLVFNPYIFNKRGAELAAWLAEQMPDRDDVAFGSEIYHLRDDLASVGHVYAGRKGGGREVGVITRRRADEHATVQLTVTRGNKVWKDRWFTRTRTGDQVEYSFHANAVIQNRITKRWLRNPGAKDWRAGLSLLRDLMKRDIDAGYAVRCGGDGNWRRTKKAVPRSIQAVFEELGMKYVNVELMWLAWTPEHYRMVDLDELPTPPGADGHPVIRSEFVRRDHETPPVPGPIRPPAPEYVGPPFVNSGRGNKPIIRAVVHSTVSPCVVGGRYDIGRYFVSSKAQGSAQYITDPGGAVQAAWDDVICWHAPPNPHTAGFEMCDIPGPIPNARPRLARTLRNLPRIAAERAAAEVAKARRAWRWTQPNQWRMLRVTARLVARFCLAYDIPLEFLTVGDLKRAGASGARGITTHANTSLAYRQSTHWDPGWWPRRRFMKLVRRHAAQIRETHR